MPSLASPRSSKTSRTDAAPPTASGASAKVKVKAKEGLPPDKTVKADKADRADKTVKPRQAPEVASPRDSRLPAPTRTSVLSMLKPSPKKAVVPAEAGPAPASSKRRVAERRASNRRSSPHSSDETLAARLRLQQYQSVMRATPLVLGAVLLNAVIIDSISLGSVPDNMLLGWMVCLVALSLVGLREWWGRRKATRPGRIEIRHMHTITLLAGTMGLLWGLVPAMLLARAAPGNQAVLVGAFIGTLCTGSLGLAVTPIAAYVFIGATSLGAVGAFVGAQGTLQTLGLLQWLLYAAIASASVRTLSSSMVARVSAEAESEHQHQLIGLLMRDFEEEGSDILWEIDAKGRLVHVSKDLAEALGRPVEALVGRAFLSVLDDLQRSLSDQDRDSAGTLRARLTQGRPFRDVLVPMQLGGVVRWWSMTAKPLEDERGTAMGWRGVARDVTETRVADRRLAWLAHYDTLTHLTNRAHFRVLLEQSLGSASQRAGHGAVMCLDLDGFKTINDTLGHATGDALLVEVGRRLKEAVGRSNVVARLGGDEFAVLLRIAVDEAQVRDVAETIIAAMQEPCQALGAMVAVRASIGIARFPQDGITVDEMMQNADMALYDAKANAPGSHRFFASRMGEQVRRRLVLERDLREALENGQLSLHFQPKVGLNQWAVEGFEALLRWKHPEHGNIPPTEFIPVAEESGLILPMGEWALMEACRQAAAWPLPLQVAVNVSPVQVMAQNLPGAVQRALDSSGLEPSRLELEITESVFINETSDTVEHLHTLRKLGVQIALDDFGTGYSSLAYLRRFPFDTLKIDRAFVRELLTSRDARAIVRNILALAKSLRMATVAEGVEEPAQVAVLEAEGCDIVQGYFVSRPMPGDQVVPFIQRWAGRDRPRMPDDYKLANTRMTALDPVN
jgi:diguanylate cyclase (GGDEF)-like protein/PAS domain S-box-containing protein